MARECAKVCWFDPTDQSSEFEACCLVYNCCSNPTSSNGAPSVSPSIVPHVTQESSISPSITPYVQEPSVYPSSRPSNIPSVYPSAILTTTPSISRSIHSLSPSVAPTAITNVSYVSSATTDAMSTTTTTTTTNPSLNPLYVYSSSNLSSSEYISLSIIPSKIEINNNNNINKPENVFVFAAVIITVFCMVSLLITIIGCRRSKKRVQKRKHVQQALELAAANDHKPQIIAITDDGTENMEIGKKGEDISHYVTQLKAEKNKESKAIMESWLNEAVHLPVYYRLFVQNGYESLDFIQYIKDEHELADIGIKNVAHQKQIMIAIARLCMKQKHDNRTKSHSQDSLNVIHVLKRTEEGVADNDVDAEEDNKSGAIELNMAKINSRDSNGIDDPTIFNINVMDTCS